MEKLQSELLVSGEGDVRAISLDGCAERCIMPGRMGAVCAADGTVFFVQGSRIVGLDETDFTQKMQLEGGPGMIDLKLSSDQTCLYALCSEADSVLMIDLLRGEPALLNCAGANPRNMAIDNGTLAVAGGENGAVILLGAKSLRILANLPMPGPVYAAAMHSGRIYALCLLPSLDSALITVSGCARSMLILSGLPGCLLAGESALYAATEGVLYTVSLDGTQILGMCGTPGRASWLAQADGRLLLLDAYSECLFCRERAGWKLMCSGVAFAALGRA